MRDASQIPTPERIASVEARLLHAFPAQGVLALPPELTRAALVEVLQEAATLVAQHPLDARLAVKTRMLAARRPFYLATFSGLPPAERHLKPFDTDNSGTLERGEVQNLIRDSFGKTPSQAWRFAAMLYWVKMGRLNSITISEASRMARHASGSGNWHADGCVDEARFAENLRLLSGHRDPFSTVALADLIALNTTPGRNPGVRWLWRRVGKGLSTREYSLAWRMAGVERRDGALVINETLYRMNIEGTLMATLFTPRQEATNVFRWHADGGIRHR